LGSTKGDIDDRTLTWIGSIGAVLAGVAKIFWASMVDIYGFRKIYSIILVLQVIMAASIYTVVSIN
jgi:MFS family permease